MAPLKSVLGVQKMIVRMKECASGRMKIVLIKLNIHHQLKFLHILQVKDLFPLGRIKMIIMDNLTERKVEKIVKLPSQSFLHLLYPLSHPSKKNPKVFLRIFFYSNLKNSDIFSRAEKSAEAFREQKFNRMCVPEVFDQLRPLFFQF